MRMDERLVGGFLNLAMGVATEIIGRLRMIGRQSDPGDPALQGLLDGLAREHLADLSLIAECRGFKKEMAPDPAVLKAAIARAFPSFPHHFGEGSLSRDAALYFAELLEEEASRFYRSLADSTTDPEAQLTLDEQSWRASGRLARLRTVLL